MTASLLAGLFIFQGLLGLITHSVWGFSASPYGYRLAIPGVLLCVAQIWLGLGLRRGRPAARWLSLGPCLLMIIGGIVIPVLVFVVGGYFEIIMLGLGVRPTPQWQVSARLFAVLLMVYSVIAAIIAFTSFRYLRSHEGRLAYGAQVTSPGVLPPESFGWVLVSAMVWIAASWVARNDVSISAQSLPRFALTSGMKQVLDKQRAEQLALVAGRGYFTADSQHVVFPPSPLSPQVLVLDLESGKLRRTGVKVFGGSDDFFDPVAPDGSSLVAAGAKRYSLRDDGVRDVHSLVWGSLGFHSPTRLLQYDTSKEELQLVDLASDRKVYSLPVPLSRRGEPSDEKPYGWTRFSQAWSRDRRYYVWMNRDRSLSVLDVGAGRIEDFTCRVCMYGGIFNLSASGKQIFVPDPVSRTSESAQGQTGALLDIPSGEWTTVSYRGSLAALLEDGSGAAFNEYPANALVFQEIGSGSRRWSLDLPGEFGSPYSSGGTMLVTRETSGDPGSPTLYASFASPVDDDPVRFVSFSSTFDKPVGSKPSPDGRYQLRVDGTRVEILDVEAAHDDEPALRTMDLLEDDELSEPVDATVTPGVLARWTEIEASEVAPEVSPEPQDFAQQAEGAMPDSAHVEPAPPPASVETTPSPGGIVKCVDTGGNVTFTQGVCPPGTRPVNAPVVDSAPSQPYRPRLSASASGASGASASSGSGNALNAAIGPGGKVQSMKTPPASCPGHPELNPFLSELTIERPGSGVSVIYVSRRNNVHQTFEAARADACDEALEKSR